MMVISYPVSGHPDFNVCCLGAVMLQIIKKPPSLAALMNFNVSVAGKSAGDAF